mmetsp:Transcript_8448/g.4574  ORF Transcript_8448/g.4574 Transcript_8448/m.4574 type:complete len:86 (+) Transcript_8448:42-299(+)
MKERGCPPLDMKDVYRYAAEFYFKQHSLDLARENLEKALEIGNYYGKDGGEERLLKLVGVSGQGGLKVEGGKVCLICLKELTGQV